MGPKVSLKSGVEVIIVGTSYLFNCSVAVSQHVGPFDVYFMN